MFATVGFSDNIVTQIALADKHGNLLGSLTKIETYMLRMTKVRKKLMEVATYPILLLGFLSSDYVGTQKLSSASTVRGGW